MFPACTRSAVKELWEKTLQVSEVNDYASSFVRAAIHHLCEDEYLHDDVHGGGAIAFKPRLTSLTEKAQQLAAENLHADLNDLTHLVSKLDRTRKRRAQPLSAQVLSPSTLRGLQVASLRGLKCLVQDYQAQLLRRVKEFQKEQATAAARCSRQVQTRTLKCGAKFCR